MIVPLSMALLIIIVMIKVILAIARAHASIQDTHQVGHTYNLKAILSELRSKFV